MLQGCRLDRLRQRRLSRICSSTICKGDAQLYHNNRNGTFSDVTESMGIDGPKHGFSCWAWDYDNDGWLDIFATCYDYTLEDVVKGMLGQPHSRLSNRLFHNLNGKGFENKTKEAGLDMVFATMGSNFGDFDNDGFLDFYLGTGDPDLATLVPNRMFKNVGGERFAEITASVGHRPPSERARRLLRRLGPRRRHRPVHRDGRGRPRRHDTTTSCSRTPGRGTTG